MYQYDRFDRELVEARVREFDAQTRRYIAGELTEEQFKPLRLMNGLYFQRQAPMLRVAVPYGLMSSKQVEMLAYIAETYDRGYGHFTTRQNIQYNWPKLESVPDILRDLARVDMHAIQTSGNCIRNVTSDHLAGVAADELADPRPYCELLRQWATLHPEFAYLPRKFKIAVSGAVRDRAATEVHDIGLNLTTDADGRLGFQVLVGGGLGRTPMIGKLIRSFLPERDLLSYMEAILRVYNQLGRRDNKYKARIKILVQSLGAEKFAELVEAQWQALNQSDLRLSRQEIIAAKSHFPAPAYLAENEASEGFGDWLRADQAFARWYRNNTRTHRVAGYRIAFISLKARDWAPGDITATQLRAVAGLARRYSADELRSTHGQNLVLADVAKRDLYAVWQQLQQHDLATPNINTLTDVISCPGLEFCSLANAEAIPVAKEIHGLVRSYEELEDLGDIRVKISGCMNACGHHHVGHIGILGVDKKGEQWYQLTLGGTAEKHAALGKRLGPAVPRHGIAAAVRALLDVYLDERLAEEPFLDTVRRVGVGPFKEGVYGQAMAA